MSSLRWTSRPVYAERKHRQPHCSRWAYYSLAAGLFSHCSRWAYHSVTAELFSIKDNKWKSCFCWDEFIQSTYRAPSTKKKLARLSWLARCVNNRVPAELVVQRKAACRGFSAELTLVEVPSWDVLLEMKQPAELLAERYPYTVYKTICLHRRKHLANLCVMRYV